MTADGGHAAEPATRPEANPQPDAEAGVDVGPEVHGEGEAEVGDDGPPPAPPARPINPRSIPKEPEWADQRAMLSAHPRWALATVVLLVVGLVVGYVSLGAIGPSLMHRCAALADPAVCNPRTEGLVLALPALSLGLGLAVSWIGGRKLARRGKRAVYAAVVGWAVFLLTTVISYGVVGGHV